MRCVVLVIERLPEVHRMPPPPLPSPQNHLVLWRPHRIHASAIIVRPMRSFNLRWAQKIYNNIVILFNAAHRLAINSVENLHEQPTREHYIKYVNVLADETGESNQEHGPRETEREIHLKLFLLITCGYQKLGSMFLETMKRRRHSITYAIIRLSMSLWIIIPAILHGRGMLLLFRCCWHERLCYILLVYCVHRNYC